MANSVSIFKRPIYLFAGWLAITLGFIGVFLPLLPTTPFIILAAYFFSKSSHRLHQWLVTHRLFGPLIVTWEKYGAIPLKAKIIATTMIVFMVSYPIFFKSFSIWIKIIVVLTITCTLSYIWTRPNGPNQRKIS